MTSSNSRAIAIVGLGCILPDAPNPTIFWDNLVDKRYSITEVPPERWNVKDYYDPDPSAPDKTYSKIGGWVRGFEFEAALNTLDELVKQFEMREKFAE